MNSVTFFVSGTPISKGSMDAFVVKSKKTGKVRAVVTDGRKLSLGPWVRAIRLAADHSITGMDWKLDGPMAVHLRFFMPRPKHHYGSRAGKPYLRTDAPTHHITKADIDKLTRAVLDALTGLAWTDDMQAYSLTTTKEYALPDMEGCQVSIEHV